MATELTTVTITEVTTTRVLLISLYSTCSLFDQHSLTSQVPIHLSLGQSQSSLTDFSTVYSPFINIPSPHQSHSTSYFDNVGLVDLSLHMLDLDLRVKENQPRLRSVRISS